MKKTIALIISVILVVALFASCTPEDIEAIATINEETEAEVTDIKASNDANSGDESKENYAKGFYLEGEMDQPLTVGSEIPENSKLIHIAFGDTREHFDIYVGGQMMTLKEWNSGDASYIVDKFDNGSNTTLPSIKLTSTSPSPEITEGIYVIKSERGAPEGTMIQEGMKLYEGTEIARLDKDRNKRNFMVIRPGPKYEDVEPRKTYIIKENCNVKEIYGVNLELDN